MYRILADMITIQPIPALNDNYIWLIKNTKQQAIIVDPGDVTPVLTRLAKEQLQLSAILITHHHWDHTNGIAELLAHHKVPVYGPAHDPVALCDQPLVDGDVVEFSAFDLRLAVLAIPGHTLGHIAYVGEDLLFCGDTLFASGCGRIFEGTASQMLGSLKKLAALPETTRVYCAHEYTQQNCEFARLVEPENQALAQRLDEAKQLVAAKLPTLPSTIALERQANPFLRCHLASVQRAVSQQCQQTVATELETFTALRQWKDTY